jgi:hypothetical protein
MKNVGVRVVGSGVSLPIMEGRDQNGMIHCGRGAASLYTRSPVPGRASREFLTDHPTSEGGEPKPCISTLDPTVWARKGMEAEAQPKQSRSQKQWTHTSPMLHGRKFDGLAT